MPVQIAYQTLAAFDQVVKHDGGNLYRAWLQHTLPMVHDIYRQEHDPFRTHLGTSVIGKKCGRAIWYGFRWASRKPVEGRMLRLWNRGHIAEATFIALLFAIGCKVYQQDENGKQYAIKDFGGHFGGSGDGVFQGCPDLPLGTYALSEFKTHNDKSFQKLKKEGVKLSKPEHFVQMQVYMRKMGLTVAVYFALNKNDEEIYAEIVHLEPDTADQFLTRAGRIIPIVEAPPRINNSPGWFDCQWCDHKPVCHLGAAPERNCRTCEFSVAKEDGKWWCENSERQMSMLFGPKEGISIEGEDFSLTKQRQLAGCTLYVKNSKM